MTSKLTAAVVAGLVGLGIAAPAQADPWRPGCEWGYSSCDNDRRDRDWRNGRDRDWDHRDRRRAYEGRTTYEVDRLCTFNTRRGPVRGYKPEGKDRCCIETSRGVSCQ